MHIDRRGAVALVLVLLVMLVAGCRREPPEAVDVTVPRAAAIEGFGLVTAASDVYEGRPSIVLDFSERVAGGQSFDERLQIAKADGGGVDGSWLLEESGTRLRFPYLDADATYKVTIRTSLEAADGDTLASEIEKEVYTGPLTPIVGFAGQGNVLPTFESRGLPVISLNQSDVDIEFMKVRERDLGRFLAEFPKNQRLYSWSLDQIGRFSDSVYMNRFALNTATNERVVSYIPVRDIAELKAPGVYFATMRKPGSWDGEYDSAMFFVSDIGLNLRIYPNELLVYANSLETGEAKPRVRLSLRNENGEELASAESDDRGLARFAYRPDPQHLLIATQGNDLSVLALNQPALDLSEFAVAGRKARDAEVFPWSGRDLYRPGETLKVAALVRDGDGKALAAQPLFATLKQPDGRVAAEVQLAPGELGYYELIREIPADAATGRWSIAFSTDPSEADSGEVFRFRVEEFLPERLKLDLETAKATLAPGDALPLEVQADYLYGAPAAGNRFTAKLAVANAKHPIESLPDFFFGDALQTLPTAPVDAVDAALDDTGALAVDVALPDGITPTGPIEMVIQGSVYETGGRAVSRNLKRVLWPAPALVGVRPLFDVADGAPSNDRARFEVIKVDADGNRIKADDLVVKLIRERRDYHWTYDPASGWRADFTARFEDVTSTSVDVPADGKGELALDVEWGDYRVEILDPATSLTLRFPFVAGWSWDDNQGSEARPDRVKVALDKAAYSGGETIVATLTPPHDGPALILLESDRVLWETLIDVKAGTTVEIPLDAEWERHDLYVTALVFRPGSSANRMTPKRALGIAPVPLERASRTVAVTLAAPDKVRPGAAFEVAIDAPSLAGQTARVRVTAVDLGVLNITRYPLPDAAAWFFAQRAYGVEIRDLYGRIIESLDGDKAQLRFGGDMALPTLPGSRRPNAVIETVDLALAPVAIGADGKARVSVPIVDFNGTLRVRALVYAEASYGAAEADTIVQAPLVAEASTPRVLSRGDRSALTLDLTNMTGADAEFTLALDANGPVTVGAPPARVRIVNGKRETVSVPLTASGSFGTGAITATLSGPGVAITRTFRVAVRPAWPAVRRTRTIVQSTPARVAPDSALRAGLIGDTINQRIAITTLPPLPYGASAENLVRYPYGCIEQTTSKAWPLALLDESTRTSLGIGAFNDIDPDGNLLPIDAARRQAMLDTALARISAMQLDDGHFAMWPGESVPVTWMTPYVSDFLISARAAGVAIPERVLDKALERLNEDLLAGGNTDYSNEHYEHLRVAEMAYAAYVLARVERAPVGTLRALFDNERDTLITALPLVYMGVALQKMGDAPRARRAIDEAFEKDYKRPRWLGDYGTRVRDEALMIALAREAGLARPEHEARAIELARSVGSRDGDLWLSTQEEIAILRLGKAYATGKPRTFGASVNVGGAAEERTGVMTIARLIEPDAFARGASITPSGEGPLFVVQDVAGVPERAEPTTRTDIAIERAFFRADGSPWSGDPVEEGEVLIARIKVSADNPIPDALIVDLSPGGLEVENLNLSDASAWANVSIDGVAVGDPYARASARYEEYRDDRYIAALSIGGGGSEQVLMYLVRAVSPGSFTVPPIVVEDMYRPNVRAVGANAIERVDVVPPGR